MTPPKTECDPTDSAWKDAPVATPFRDSFRNEIDIDQTEARLVYDDRAIYVLFVCHDSRPRQVTGREISPEATFNGEDTVTFSIDTFHTRSGTSLSRFMVNAIGTHSESIAGGHASKAEWRGLWRSTAKRTPDGYIVQMTIPWKILNFPTAEKPLDMDLNFERYQARTKDASQWAYTTPSFKPELLGTLSGVVLPAKDNRNKLQFLAYDAPTETDSAFANRAGLDVRYAVSPKQTALLSISPDFINIEQQIAGVSFVHTERFLTDARPFFTEGGDYFNPVGPFEYGIPLYSQRIGAINAGAKFYGQVSAQGKLGAFTVDESDGSKAEFANYQVNSGPLFSNSFYASSFDGLTSDRLVGDIISKRWGFWSLGFNGAVEAQSHSMETAGDYSVNYSGAKLYSSLVGIWVDTSFNPPLAYIPWQGRRGFYSYSSYNDTIKKGPIHDYSLSLYAPDFYEVGGIPQERGVSASAQITTRADQQIGITRNLVDYATGSDDDYDATFTFNASNRFKQFGMEYLAGRQDGAPSHYLDLRTSLRLFRKIDLGLEHSVLAYSPSASQSIVTLGWQIDARRAVTGRFVNTNGEQNAFLSYSSSGFAGAETYVIIGDPNALTFSRMLSLKFVWAF